MKRFNYFLIVYSCLAILLFGCRGKGWYVKKIAVIEDLKTPECMVLDPGSDTVFISCIETTNEAWWADDGKGFIAAIDSKGEMKKLRWLNSTPEALINAPKGMCVLKGYLYFSDNSRLMRYPVNGSGKLEEISLPETQKLNDLAADGEAVYVSDTARGLVYRVDLNGNHKLIKAPEGVNGITFHKENMYAVSWDLHEIYELDKTGKDDPRPFGLANHFVNLDGIEVLDDGTFIVSDFKGNKVCAVSSDRKKVKKLVTLESPADIGIDREQGLLYVPQFMKDKAVVFSLKKR